MSTIHTVTSLGVVHDRRNSTPVPAEATLSPGLANLARVLAVLIHYTGRVLKVTVVVAFHILAAVVIGVLAAKIIGAFTGPR